MRNLHRYMRAALKWVLAGIVVLPALALAHVATDTPVARQFYCRGQADFWSPNPSDAGCRALLEANKDLPHYPGQQWNQVSIEIPKPQYEDQAVVEQYIPDGKLCSANNPEMRGLDQPSDKWHKTPITPKNGFLQVIISGTAPHVSSDVYIYLSKPGYNSATMPLKWSDLELLKKERVDKALPDDGTALNPLGLMQGYFRINVPIPAGRSGNAVLYTRFQRDDPNGEGFYNCSDVTFSGGTAPEWYAKGPFLLPGFTPHPGDKIRFRVLGADDSHDEVVDIRHPITDANPAVWGLGLVQALSSFKTIVQIGELKGTSIIYNTVEPGNNQIFLADKNASIGMSIITDDGGTPVDQRPPVANIQGPAEATEGETVTFDGGSSVGYNGKLTYIWSTNAAKDASNIPNHESTFSFTVAPYFDAIPGGPQPDHNVSLTVYDHKNLKKDPKQVVFLIKKAGGDDGFPQWKPNGGYNSGSQVSNYGVKYRCKQGSAGAWCGQNENEPGKPGSTFWQRAWDVVP